MTQVRILHVVHSLAVGGLENGLVNLINRLDPEKFQHTVCCLTKSSNFADRIDRDRVKIIELAIASDKFRFPLIRLARLLQELNPDIVHTRGWATVDGTFAARLARVPCLIHGEHGRDFIDKDGDNWKRNQIRRLIGWNVCRYVVVCDYFRPWLIDSCGVAADKILHIPNGVDGDRFFPRAVSDTSGAVDSTSVWRRELKIPDDAVVVGSIGRLDPVKDFPTMLKAFAEVTRQYPRAIMVIVGDGAIKESLIRLSKELGVYASLRWLGERSDVPELLRQFDLFVQSSIFEGMSNTILEAMASGLPVVATATGGNGELVTGGINGALVPVSDPKALGSALQRYVTDSELRLRHGANGRHIVEEKFTLAAMASSYADLYLSQAAAHSS